MSGILRLERAENKVSGHSWFGSTAKLPAVREGEVTLLDGVISLHQGDKKETRKVRLKCRALSPESEAKK